MATDVGLVYADSSALVKLIIDEPESPMLRAELPEGLALRTCAISVVEVPRAARLASRSRDVNEKIDEILGTCSLIDVDEDVLMRAKKLASESLRTLDAIHVASALRVEADSFLSYDLRQLQAARAAGLAVLHPGLKRPAE